MYTAEKFIKGTFSIPYIPDDPRYIAFASILDDMGITWHSGNAVSKYALPPRDQPRYITCSQIDGRIGWTDQENAETIVPLNVLDFLGSTDCELSDIDSII